LARPLDFVGLTARRQLQAPSAAVHPIRSAQAPLHCSAAREPDRLKVEFSVKIFRLGKERRTVKASKFSKAQKAFNQYALGGLRWAIAVVFSRLGILLPH
jgi:hypothetical protein